MLPDTPDVLDVALRPDGVFARAAKGSIFADMSTISPHASLELAEQGRRLGVRVVDAPVSGGEMGAKEASLSIMVGGEDADFEDLRPVFAALGTTVVRVGQNGAGQTVKAANQLIVGGTLGLLAEAITFLEASGADTVAALQVIAGGLAGSRVLDRKGGAMLARDFKPGFRVDLHHKDLGIVLTSARQTGTVIPITAVVAELMASLRANGDGALDHSAMLKAIQRLSGRAAG
jgi:2-hydroxy-3-oxopropionate reductase